MALYKLLILLGFYAYTHAVEIPSYLHVCHKEDANLVQCMTAAIEELRPYLVTGVAEDNIPTLEPLIMTDFFSEEIAGMKITTYNVSAWGCSEYFVRSLRVDMDSHVIVLDVDIPKLRIEAHYNVDGKLLLVPVKGGGNLEANITDVESTCTLNGELYEKDGENYLKFATIDLKVKTGGGQVRLENMFNGDKILLNMVNDVVNKNLDMFMHELMPVIEKALQAKFLDVSNAIVQPYTYKQLFPH